MSQMKKKSFSFEEEELSWINPLLVEWAKENEGKKQSDLVLQLLKEHRDRKPTLKETLDGATSNMKEKLSDYSSKSKDSLQNVQSKMKTGSEGFRDRLRKAEANVRTKLEDIKAERSKPKEDPEEK
jgi:ElaB/YqjD/DUF883 family membrane-anchored ribosome-binding protein